MNLFAEGSKNNPNEQARKEQEDFQAWQQAENEKMAKDQAEYLARRIALMATMTEEEWEEYLQVEATNYAATEFKNNPMKAYETR